MAKLDVSRRRWDRRAPYYDASGDQTERWAIGNGREWICSRAHGRTLEVAIGTGRNLALYPPDVQLTGVDLSPAMLTVARQRAQQLGRAIDLREAAAENLPFPDATNETGFDTVICTLALCSVADRSRAIAEMWRVIRPGGSLLLLDHLEWRWLRGRPANLALRQGFVADERERMRLGGIERIHAHRPVGS